MPSCRTDRDNRPAGRLNIAERSWDRGKELNVEVFAAGQTWGQNQIRGAVGALVSNWQSRWEQRLSSGRQAFVMMVQSADFGEGEDLTFLWELNPSVPAITTPTNSKVGLPN